MNDFIEVAHDSFTNLSGQIDRIIERTHELFPQLEGGFESFAHFLEIKEVRESDVVNFLNKLRQFFLEESQENEDLAIVRYGSKLLFVCCPHMEEQEDETGSFLITGFNTLPEEILEGSGLRYWGE